MTLANCPMRISLPDPLKSKVSLSFTIKKVYETLNQLILLFILQFSLHSLFQLFFPQNTLQHMAKANILTICHGVLRVYRESHSAIDANDLWNLGGEKKKETMYGHRFCLAVINCNVCRTTALLRRFKFTLAKGIYSILQLIRLSGN